MESFQFLIILTCIQLYLKFLEFFILLRISNFSVFAFMRFYSITKCFVWLICQINAFSHNSSARGSKHFKATAAIYERSHSLSCVHMRGIRWNRFGLTIKVHFQSIKKWRRGKNLVVDCNNLILQFYKVHENKTWAV